MDMSSAVRLCADVQSSPPFHTCVTTKALYYICKNKDHTVRGSFDLRPEGKIELGPGVGTSIGIRAGIRVDLKTDSAE